MRKTKKLIVDYRKRLVEQAPINIDGTVVERVKTFKFLGVHQRTTMVSTHPDSREEGMTKPIPPQETE